MPTVVKVGGSLFDWPELGPRLRRWLCANHASEVLLVPGGGAVADAVRDLDRCHALGEEAAHWLALRALGLNAQFLSLLVAGVLVAQVEECAVPWKTGQIAVLDALTFAWGDEGRRGSLPHTWEATSDSLAARVALVARADRLVLLKSVTIPTGLSWGEAGRRGFVDSLFAGVVAERPQLQVTALNLRQA